MVIMGSHNMLTMTEAILQVFELHEDKFFWPLDSQRDAKMFVKLMHDVGMPYEDISRQVGELEDNFKAWRKGIGRVGIGTRMLDMINNSVGDVMDDDDDIMFNLQQLAKVRSKSKGEADIQKIKSQAATDSTRTAASQSKTIPSASLPQATPHTSTTQSRPAQKVTTPSSQQPTHVQAQQKASPVSHQPTPVKSQQKASPLSPQHLPPAKSLTTAQPSQSTVQTTPVVPAAKTAVTPVSPKADLTQTQQFSQASVKLAQPKDEPKQVKSPEIHVATSPTTSTQAGASSQQAKDITRHKSKDGEAKGRPTSQAGMQDKVDRSSKKISDESSDDDDESRKKQGSSSQNEPEVDEVRRKMDAIKKKVEMMKRMKAEQMAQKPTSYANDTSSGDKSPDDKYEEVKKKLQDTREKFKDDSQKDESQEADVSQDEAEDDESLKAQDQDCPEAQDKESPEVDPSGDGEDDAREHTVQTNGHLSSETAEEKQTDNDGFDTNETNGRESPQVTLSAAPKETGRPQPPSTLQFQAPSSDKYLAARQSSLGSTPSTVSPSLQTPNKAEAEEMSSSSSDEDEVADAERYDSDLDPDNYDSDLEYQAHQQVKDLCSQITKTKAKIGSSGTKGGPHGHIYVFTDSPPGEIKRHRIRIGCSRRPERMLAHGRCYNPSLRQVASTPVNSQTQALAKVRENLREFQIMGHKSWYEGPIEVLLKATADGIERFNKGGNLMAFRSSR